MKRILFVNPCPDIGGAEVSLLTLLRGLDRARYQPVLLLPSEGRAAERARLSNVGVAFFPMKAMTIDRPLFASLRDGLKALWSLDRLHQFVKEIEPSLIHVNSYRVGIPLSFAARRLNVPVVWHVRDIPSSRTKRDLVARSVLWTDRAIAISKAVSQYLGRYYPHKVQVLYNPLEIDQFTMSGRKDIRSEFGIPANATVFCNIGQLIPWKGQDFLLRAFSRLPDEWNVWLLIVGGGVSPVWAKAPGSEGYPEYLRRLADRLQIADRVVFTGFRDDIPDILDSVDSYVHSSARPEPFGRVLIEAMAAQKLVIGPAHGGVPEIIQDGLNGKLYAPNQIDALVAVLRDSVQHRGEWKRMGYAGLQYVKSHFSAEKHVREVCSLFDELLRQKDSGGV